MTQGKELRPSGGDGVEARNAGATLRHRVGVIEIEVVDEVVAGEQPVARIRIQANCSLVVAHDLVEGGGSEAEGSIRSRDVLQHALCRNGPGLLRNDGVGKNTLGGVNASRRSNKIHPRSHR